MTEQPRNPAEKTNQKTQNYNLDLSIQRGHATLTDSQQTDEIQRLILSRAWNSVAEEVLKHPTVVEFDKSLGFRADWKLETGEFGVDAIEVNSPNFSPDLCIAPILLRYKNVTSDCRSITSNLEYQLVVNGLAYIDDDGEPMIGNISCWSNQTEVDAQKAEFAELQEHSYLNYLRVLTPSNRRSAIFDLAYLTWGTDDPKFLTDRQLHAATTRLGIADFGYFDHTVGLVEFEWDHCKVPITYELYGYLHEEKEMLVAELGDGVLEPKYYLQIQILACVSDKTPTSTSDIRCELSIENTWFSIVPIEDYERKNLMIVS